jgi:deoxycytidylate deaminase
MFGVFEMKIAGMYQFDNIHNVYVNVTQPIVMLSNLPASIKRGFEAALVASNHSDGLQRRLKMGAAIYAGSRLLSIGFNQYQKTKPGNKFFKVGENGVVKEFLKTIHAEQNALIKIRHRDYSNNKLSMYIYRSDSNGNPATSAPCPLCQADIKKAGIAKVYFIAPGGYLGYWNTGI